MKIAFVSSLQDKAGMNIRHHLLQLLDADPKGWREQGRTYEFIEVDGRLIHAEGIDRKTDADGIIFISPATSGKQNWVALPGRSPPQRPQ